LARWRWALFLVVFALAFGCGKGMEVEGESGADDDGDTDDDTGPTEPPPAPVDCWRDGSQENQGKIVLVWEYNTSDYDQVDKFVIDRRKGASGSWDLLIETEDFNTSSAYQQYEDGTAKCGTTYYYRIYASNSAGDSDYCGPFSASFDCQ